MKKDVTYILIIIVLLLVGFFTYDKYAKIKDDHTSLTEALEIKDQEVELYKNKEGKWTAEKGVMELTTEQLKDNADLLGIDNRSLAKQVGRLSRLVTHLDAQLEARGEGSTELLDSIIVPVDSLGPKRPGIPVKTFSWSNTYLSLDGTVLNNRLDFKYTYNSSFTVTSYNKKEGLFKKPNLVVDVIFDDPGAQTMSMTSIQVKQPPKKFYEKWWFHAGVGFLGGAILVR